ncbi:MAG: tripartite tricarboxylate transporter substrate binding protein [Alphaproteobacteria bacterium]|nr:MAG: tripartite tricarboxylate transporter substrate binding protein [Alphaproteobacteria bacterium]
MLGTMTRRTAIAVTAAGLALAGSLGVAKAEYPEKPITLVIPLGAGGSHDLNARVITSIIPQYLGQPMIVRLSPGAGGQKGTQEVANAKPDGYTLLFTHNYIDMLQQFVEKLPYDPMKDFIPIARINYAPIGIVVRADSPYKSYEELMAAAKANPGGIRMAHSGNWGALFVPAAQIMKATGTQFNLVPYQAGGPAMQALLSGDADVTMGFPSTLTAQVAAGKIRILATAGKERMLPDVPSFAELGIGGDVGFMHRIVMAPAGVPDEVVAKLTDAFQQLVKDKTFKKMMGRLNETIDLLDGPTYQKMREEQAVAYKALVESLTQ